MDHILFLSEALHLSKKNKKTSHVAELWLRLKPSGKFKLAQNVAQLCSQTATVFNMLSVQVPLSFTCGLITSLVDVLSFGPIISECLFPLLYFYHFVDDPTALPFKLFADTSLSALSIFHSLSTFCSNLYIFLFFLFQWNVCIAILIESM